MDFLILNNFFYYSHFFRNKCFLIDYFDYWITLTTGSNFRININNNPAILMMPQPQNYIVGSLRPQILKLFARVPQNEDPLCPLPSKCRLKFMDTFPQLLFCPTFRNLLFNFSIAHSNFWVGFSFCHF